MTACFKGHISEFIQCCYYNCGPSTAFTFKTNSNSSIRHHLLVLKAFICGMHGILYSVCQLFIMCVAISQLQKRSRASLVLSLYCKLASLCENIKKEKKARQRRISRSLQVQIEIRLAFQCCSEVKQAATTSSAATRIPIREERFLPKNETKLPSCSIGCISRQESLQSPVAAGPDHAVCSRVARYCFLTSQFIDR